MEVGMKAVALCVTMEILAPWANDRAAQFSADSGYPIFEMTSVRFTRMLILKEV